jgi:polyhydroxyalkanoate synthesis regulator phasin
MTSRKSKSSKKANPISGDTARKIWLAGIGAYGKAFSEAQESFSKVSAGTSKVFDELVQKGEVIETMVSVKGKDIAEDIIEKTGVGSLDIDDRIEKMRARLRKTDRTDHDDIEDRLDAVEVKLDMILELLKPKKPAPKKRTPVKRAARKPAVKKPAKKTKK